MRDIKISVDTEGYVTAYEKFIANQFENEATRLVFDLPECYRNENFKNYVVFRLSNDAIVIRKINDTSYDCIIDRDVTKVSGVCLFQTITKKITSADDLADGVVMASQPISGYIKESSYRRDTMEEFNVDANIKIYLDEFDALLSEIRNVDDRLSTIMNGKSGFSEIIDARGKYATLRKRLDTEKNNIENKTNNALMIMNDTINTNKLELDNKIQALASGSPLVASSVSDMTDTKKVYVNTSDGNWYYHNGTNWLAGGVYLANKLEEKSINANYLTKSLLDLLDIAIDTYNVYNAKTGSKYVLGSIGYNSSDNMYDIEATNRIRCKYIPISHDAIIKFNNTDGLCKYGFFVIANNGTVEDYNKLSNYNSTYDYHKINSSNPNYLIVVMSYTDDREITDENVEDLYNRLTVTSYIPNENADIYKKINACNDDIESLHDFIINKDKETYKLHDWKIGSLSESTGEINFLNETRKVTVNLHKIYGDTLIIEPLEGYKVACYLYDKEGLFVNKISLSTDKIIVDKSESYCYYRIIIGNINDTEADNTFEDNIIISQTYTINEQEEKEKITSFQNLKISNVETDYTDLASKNSEYLYALYDELLANYPNYISKNIIGYAEDVDGNEDNTRPIYEYYVHQFENDSLIYDTIPTVLITCSLHGNEKSTGVAVYEFLKSLFDYSSDIFNLRNKANYRIVPIVNRYGYDNNIRQNARGLDINRTFYNDDSLEGRCVKEWITRYDGVNTYHIDLHNTANKGWYTYFTSHNETLRKAYSSLISLFSIVWANRYNFDVYKQLTNEDRFIFTKTPASGAGTDWVYNNTNIKQSATLEVGNWDGATKQLYSKTVINMSLDLLVNYLYYLFN